jgi:hypothetical protein
MNATAKTTSEETTSTGPQHLHWSIRYMISDGAVLTLTHAGEILPGREATNRRWIEQNVEKIYSPSGRSLYLWGDIVAAMKEGT